MAVRKESIQVDVTGADKGARDLDRFGKAADKAADEVGGLGKAFVPYVAGGEKAKGVTDALGEEMRESARAASKLDSEIKKLGGSLTGLRVKFADGMDAGVLKEIKASEQQLSALKRIRKELGGGDGEGKKSAPAKVATKAIAEATKTAAKAAQAITSQLTEALSGAFKSLPPQAQAGILAGGLAIGTLLAPAIGAGISGGILLGLGGAGLFAGIKLAARDPGVQAAFKDFGATAMASLNMAASSFIGPLKSAGAAFKQAFTGGGFQESFQRMFSALAGTVKPLADGLIGLARNAFPGIERAAKASAPVIKAIAAELPRLGAQMGAFFDKIADSGPGASAFFKFLLRFIGDLIVVTGTWLQQMSQVFAGMAALPGLGHWFGDAQRGAEGATSAASGFSDEIRGGKGALGGLRAELDGVNEALRDLLSNFLSLDQAELAAKQGFADLREELVNGRRSLDENTQAGRDNAKAVFEQLQNLLALKDAQIKNGESVAVANQHFEEQLAVLERLLLSLGYSRQAVDALLGPYRNAGMAAEQGLGVAETAAKDLGRAVGEIPGDVPINVRLTGMGVVGSALSGLKAQLNNLLGGASVSSGIGRAPGRAAGGPVAAGRPYVVGEDRPELFIPDTNGRILPSVPTSGGSGGATQIRVVLDFSGHQGDDLATNLQRGLRTGSIALKVIGTRVVPG